MIGYLLVFWLGLGVGMAGTAYLMMTAQVIGDGRIQVERPVKSPQHLLAEWLQ